MTLQQDYQVTLDGFCGPMDLLLFLIRRAEVDIHEIPISAITDQYLAFLRHLSDVDIDQAGEFLVMAATLMELKSRSLVPPEVIADGGGEGDQSAAIDPRSELIQQLLAYQRFRSASEQLDERRLALSRRYPSRPAAAQEDLRDEDEAEVIELELEDVHVLDLSDAYERIMASIDFTRLGDHMVEMDDTPLALFQEDLIDRLGRAEGRRLTLQHAFDGQHRLQRIGLFLATLELVRQRRVSVVQNDLDDCIEVTMENNEDVQPVDTPPETHEDEL